MTQSKTFRSRCERSLYFYHVSPFSDLAEFAFKIAYYCTYSQLQTYQREYERLFNRSLNPSFLVETEFKGKDFILKSLNNNVQPKLF